MCETCLAVVRDFGFSFVLSGISEIHDKIERHSSLLDNLFLSAAKK